MESSPGGRARLRLISLIILFHLFGVLITPNPASYLTQSVAAVYGPYMNFLGLSSTWSFFAPEPTYLPTYLDYVIKLKNGAPISGRFPAEANPYFFRDRFNRDLAFVHTVLATDDNVRNMFVRRLCLENPGMESADLTRVMKTEPSLETVLSGKRKITDPDDTKIEVLGTYYCPEPLL